MELKINTATKTIRFEGQVNINDLLDALDNLGLDFSEWEIEGSEKDYIVVHDSWKNPWAKPSITPIQPYTNPWIIPTSFPFPDYYKVTCNI